MDKLVAQPFVDESGNLVIPPEVLGKHDEEQEFALTTTDGKIRIILKGGKIIRIIEPEELPQAIQEPSEIEPIAKPTGIADAEMLKLAQSSMDFWDNPVDDAVWNNA